MFKNVKEKKQWETDIRESDASTVWKEKRFKVEGYGPAVDVCFNYVDTKQWLAAEFGNKVRFMTIILVAAPGSGLLI